MMLYRPFNPEKAGGNVERWLIECEASMRGTLQSICKNAFAAYETTPRVDWIMQWPGQVVLCIGSMYWTHNTAEAIMQGGLPSYESQCTEELMQAGHKGGQ